MLLLNLQTYQQLTREVVLAEVAIGQPSNQGLPLRLAYPDRSETYRINSPEWRLDARFVKWKPWLSLFGKDPVVRLERLEERAGSTVDGARIHGYDLAAKTEWQDEIISAITERIGLIDSVYGSSVYMPAIPGAEYRITASISGLVARPLNQQAQGAVLEWSSR